MKYGIPFNFGDVILANIPFPDQTGEKRRPVVILFNYLENIVVAGVTSNLKRDGILITKNEEADVDCKVRLDYIFTITGDIIDKKLFSLEKDKKKIVFIKLIDRLIDFLY
jgi:hypothetical protein